MAREITFLIVKKKKKKNSYQKSQNNTPKNIKQAIGN